MNSAPPISPIPPISSTVPLTAPPDDTDIQPPPLKRAKLHDQKKNHVSCCSCHESFLPYLVLIGCSNHHTMCHVCTRMFVSSKIVMNKFPRYYPGKINSPGDLECPVCRESINGVTNMFVFQEMSTHDINYQCPYKELLPANSAPVSCAQDYKLLDLQKHIIQTHNQTVKCPNCSQWLCDGEKNMEDLIHFHIMKHCQDIKCHGCDRTSNMINLYMHSIIGLDRTCDTAKQFFHLHGQQLADSFYLFEQSENLTELASIMMRWNVQYLYHRQFGLELGVDIFGKEFHRIYYGFLFQVFCHIHAELAEMESLHLLNKLFQLLRTNHKNEYEENILLLTLSFSKNRQLRLDRISQLPFLYRILVMTVSDFDKAKNIAKKYPKNITPTEQADIDKLVQLFTRLINTESPHLV